MRRRLVLLDCCLGLAAACLLGCSNSPESNSPENCGFCDSFGWATGPEIVTRYSTIAAIETVAPCGSTPDPCGVKSAGIAGQWPGDAVSPIPTIDAGWAANLCARRYTCPQPPPPAWLDGARNTAGCGVEGSGRRPLVVGLPGT